MIDTIEILKQARKRKGITLKELSEKSGVSLGTVNKLFSGAIASVKVSTAKKLANALEISLDGDTDNTLKIENVENNYGFVKCAALTNEIRVADVEFNTKTTVELINKAAKKNVSVAVFPELNLTSYTLGDLVAQENLIFASLEALKTVAKATVGLNMLVFVGMPVRVFSRLYNCAVAICNGEILAVIPKKNLPNYNEFSERRSFCEADDEVTTIDLFGKSVPFGYKIILQNNLYPELKIACEICEDLWVPNAPSIYHSLEGATLIVNLSTSNEIAGKEHYRRQMISTHSSKCICGYVYASSGYGESTSQTVFGGHNVICDAGRIVAESQPFDSAIAIGDIDCGFLEFERSKKFK